MQLGQAGPREIRIFSGEHDQKFKLHLTELHESTHFHLITNTTIGQIQHACDGILTGIEQSLQRAEDLSVLGMTEASLADLEASYHLIESNTVLLHEVTASYIEYAFSKTFERQTEFEPALVERSEIYGLPIIERCRLFESRLSSIYRSGSFRGNVIYTLAKIALNRRLAPASPRQTLAEGVVEIYSSAPPPDLIFSAYADVFEHRWEDLKELLESVDAAFSDHVKWTGGSAEDLFYKLRGTSQASIAQVKNLENLHKEFLYHGLSLSFDPDGFSSHIEAMEHVGKTVLPSLRPLLGSWKLEVDSQSHPIKPAVVDPTLAVVSGLRIKAGSDANTLSTMVRGLSLKGFSRQVATVVAHVHDSPVREVGGVEGAMAIDVAAGECLFTMILSQIHDETGDVMRERISFSLAVDAFVHVIPSLAFHVAAIIASSCHPLSDELTKSLARKFSDSVRHVFFRPHGSMYVETVEFGSYKFQTPAFAAFIRSTKDAFGGLALFLGANDSFWTIDQVTETRLIELLDWAQHHEQIEFISSLPFDSDLVSDIRYAITSSLLRLSA